jgi:hypothetical protein
MAMTAITQGRLSCRNLLAAAEKQTAKRKETDLYKTTKQLKK